MVYFDDVVRHRHFRYISSYCGVMTRSLEMRQCTLYECEWMRSAALIYVRIGLSPISVDGFVSQVTQSNHDMIRAYIGTCTAMRDGLSRQMQRLNVLDTSDSSVSII